MLHGIQTAEEYHRRAGAMDALHEMKAAGKIRAVGISTHLGTGEIMDICATDPRVEVVLTTANIDGQMLEGDMKAHLPLIEKIHAAGKGICLMKTLAQGGLTQTPATIRQAIRFNLSLPYAHSVCVGVNRVAVDAAGRLRQNPTVTFAADDSSTKFAAQAIRKAADIGWKPVIYLNNVSSSVASTMKPAGFDNVQGVITAQYLMDPTDKQWDTDPNMKSWVEWMKKSNAGASLQDASNVFAYTVSFLMHETLKKCGDNLTRENLMKQAANHQKLKVPLLLPGITVNTSPTDYYPIQAVQLSRFKGETWELFGDVMHAESS